jgi:hypothetical protein
MDLLTKDEAAASSFSAKFLPSLPPEFQEEAQAFLSSPGCHSDLIRLFSTQRYIVKVDDEAVLLLKEFINEPANCELRHRFVEMVTLDPDRPYSPDYLAELRFRLDSAVSSLSILQCSLRHAAFIAVSNDLSDVFAVVDERTVIKIDSAAGKSSQLSLRRRPLRRCHCHTLDRSSWRETSAADSPSGQRRRAL